MTAGVGALTALSLLSQPSLGPLEYAVAVLAWASAVVQVWRPVGGALAATVLAVLSPMATTAATVGALQTAWRTRFRTAVAVSLAGIGAHLLQWVWHPNAALDFKWWALLVAAVYGALLGWGTLARSHRDLVISLRERARRAEAEQGRRVAEARAAERRGLAREMHDVLANRLSLVATHAGALEFRPDAPPEKIALAAGVVRDGVHQALEELREVIGLLREDEGVSGVQPTLADLDGLLADARGAGQVVEAADGLGGAAPPDTVGRTAFRVVQEGLTNARKHAAGLPVAVSLEGAPGGELVIAVVNPLPEAGTGPAVPGSGLGLVGLTERVRLAGGSLDHEATGGRFALRARLPWPT
ncbi:sensor histidine kinase [Glycomyces mayteni]